MNDRSERPRRLLDDLSYVYLRFSFVLSIYCFAFSALIGVERKSTGSQWLQKDANTIGLWLLPVSLVSYGHHVWFQRQCSRG